MMAINRYRLKTLISKNNVQAKRVEKLLNNIDYLIGAILLGNNFVNILAASIATLLSIKLYGEGSVIIASMILTVVILIFAENTPKTFAAKNPERVALPASWMLDLIINLFKVIPARSEFPCNKSFNRTVGVSRLYKKFLIAILP